MANNLKKRVLCFKPDITCSLTVVATLLIVASCLTRNDFLLFLQALQQRQAVEGASVAVIDQSIDNEDVRKALAKNPDISAERSNLLQGIYAV